MQAYSFAEPYEVESLGHIFLYDRWERYARR